MKGKLLLSKPIRFKHAKQAVVIPVTVSDIDGAVGTVTVEVIKNNIVISVERVDEAQFGPASVVVV